jgi:hypothetical protein
MSNDAPSYESFDANRIKHMEMIQAVVSRLAGNSSLVKGWALTLTGALLGFAVDRSSSGLAAAALVPIVFFWGLDAYYLRAERLFRELYNEVRKATAQTADPFYMAATSSDFTARVSEEVKSWPRTLIRTTLVVFYGLLAVVSVVLILVLCSD